MDFKVMGVPLEEAVAQMQEAVKHNATYAALMADHHIGYSIPMGWVLISLAVIRPFVLMWMLVKLKVTYTGR
jgi:tRNA-splicing ligase RtcB